MIKLVFCLRRLPHLDRAQFQQHWREVHAPLVAERAEVLGLKRYVQSHTLDDSLVQSLAVARGSPAPFDGVAELWWDGLEVRTGARREEARRASAELLADERRFIDLSASPIFFTAEWVVVGDAADEAAGEVARDFLQARGRV